MWFDTTFTANFSLKPLNHNKLNGLEIDGFFSRGEALLDDWNDWRKIWKKRETVYLLI